MLCPLHSFNIRNSSEPFKRQAHKMAEHTQTIRRQIAHELFECVWQFCEIGTERVNLTSL